MVPDLASLSQFCMNCSVSRVWHFDVTSSNLVDPFSQNSFEPFKFNEVTLWYPFTVQGLAGGSGPEKYSITNAESQMAFICIGMELVDMHKILIKNKIF